METVILILVAAVFGSATAYYYWTPRFRERKGLVRKVFRCCKCNSFWTYQTLYLLSSLTLSLLCGYKMDWEFTGFLAGFAAAYAGEWLGDLYARYDEFRDMQEIRRLEAATKTKRIKWN